MGILALNYNVHIQQIVANVKSDYEYFISMRFYQCYWDELVRDEDHSFVLTSIKVRGFSWFTNTRYNIREVCFDILQYQYPGDPAGPNSEGKLCHFRSSHKLFPCATGGG